jgi:phosphoserine phosphatase
MSMNPLAPIDWDVPYSQWILTIVQGQSALRWQPHRSATERWEYVRSENIRTLVEGLRYFMPLDVIQVDCLSDTQETAWDFTLALEEPCAFFGMFHLVKDALDGFQLDWSLHPVDASFPRVKSLVLSDMDSTLLEGECIDELADFVGRKEEVSRITTAAMNGLLDFENALTQRVALLKGLPYETVHQVLKSTPRMQGDRTLMQTMKKQGSFNVLVSGGFTPFTEALCEELGMDTHQANHLAVEEGLFTGQVCPPILGQDAKLEVLHYYATRLNVPLQATLALGDGANDLKMIQASGLGVAFHAKPSVQAQSRCIVRFNDLTALLYFQGLPQSTWVH